MLRSNAKFVPGTSPHCRRISPHFDKDRADAANDFGGSNPGKLAAWVRFPAARVKDTDVYGSGLTRIFHTPHEITTACSHRGEEVRYTFLSASLRRRLHGL